MLSDQTNGDSLFRMAGIGQALVSVAKLKLNGFTMLPSGRILASNGYAVLYYSDDDGQTWQGSATDSYVGFLQEVSPLPVSTLFSIIHFTPARSVDGGNTWQFAGQGIRKGKILQLRTISDSNYVACTGFGLWKTEDAGLNWELLMSTQKANFINYFEITSAGGIVVINGNQVYYAASTDDPFEDITPNQTSVDISSKVFVNPTNNHFYLTTDNGLFRSNNLGQSWVHLSSLPYIKYVSFNPSGRIVANSALKIYHSDNNGQTWTEGSHPFLNIERTWVSPTGTMYMAPISYNTGQNKLLAFSEDNAETWQVTGYLPDPLVNSTVVMAPNDHLYQTTDEHTYISVNKGQTWQTLPCPESPGAPTCNTGVYLTFTPSYRLFLQTYPYRDCFISTSIVTEGAYIEGHVRVDADADCSTPDAQEPLKNRILEAEGGGYSYFTNTDTEGHYIFFVDTGAYQVSVQNPSGIWWDYCDDSITVNLPELFVTDTVDFAAVPLSFCPLMTVNVGAPQLRRCFDNEVYVEYCNQGTEPADSAWVDIMLDPYLSLVSSVQPYEDLGGNTIRFFVGDVPSGECSQFQLTVHVDCDSTVLGQTHCIMAHGFPDTLCTILPNWSGANIEAMVTCQDSTLQFNLKNTGSAHSQTLDYIIIEDDIVLMSGQEDYDISEDLILDFPANGSTWRIESEQEPGHPFSNLALAFAEGCGGFGSLGYINQFPVNGIQPSWHRMCVENTGSFDPNDKQGFPIGTGSEHNIRPGQTIDYLIRFQNTGTDTAFTVVIRDTLSAFLNPLNIRPGASSHPYTWNLSGQGVISFTFNNIMLPDSNVNEPRSHGFVQFSIAPYLDVPLGSVIENSAAIFFDFNEPVITNTTWHTIQKSPLTSSLQPEPKTASAGLAVWPNPFSDRTNIHVEKKTSGNLLLNIYDSRGKLLVQKTATGPDIELHAKDLPTGLYWAEVRDSQGKIVGNGKLVKE